MNVEHWDKRWGEVNERSMRKKLESEGFNVVKYTYPPGTFFANHSHDVDKKDTVLEGRFRMRAQGEEFVLGPGDMLLVPAGVVHEAEVMGKKPVVSLDATKIRS